MAQRAVGVSEEGGRRWVAVLRRVQQEAKQDDVSVLAGGVAFYTFLSIFPGLTALVSLFGLLADPAQVARQVQALSGLVPDEALALIDAQLAQLTAQSPRSLSLAAALGVLVALWTATKGAKAVIGAMNTAYDVRERRGFFTLNGLALLLTVGAVVLGMIAVGAVIVVPAVLSLVGMATIGELLVRWLRWPALAAVILFGVAFIYRYGPSRTGPKPRWITPGAITATSLWLAVSALFSLYVSNFGKYDKLYGSLGVIIILLTWLLLSAYALILGAELNAELERGT